jgi:hypothetical protein
VLEPTRGSRAPRLGPGQKDDPVLVRRRQREHMLDRPDGRRASQRRVTTACSSSSAIAAAGSPSGTGDLNGLDPPRRVRRPPWSAFPARGQTPRPPPASLLPAQPGEAAERVADLDEHGVRAPADLLDRGVGAVEVAALVGANARQVCRTGCAKPLGIASSIASRAIASHRTSPTIQASVAYVPHA